MEKLLNKIKEKDIVLYSMLKRNKAKTKMDYVAAIEDYLMWIEFIKREGVGEESDNYNKRHNYAAKLLKSIGVEYGKN